ncbi:MAG: hypothetical protein KKF74_00895 [Nanoarchaeota archaeon]|nr:hypothetical protein [Nanoarchaeota archaeon]
MITTYSPELDNIDIFFSPAKALERMIGLYERDGVEQGLKADVFKPVREAWAAAVFLLGYSQIAKHQYWLRENPTKNEAPDIFAISIREPQPDERGVCREIMEIEVCEYDDHAKNNIADHIKEKLCRKAYNPFTFLLCYIHTKGQTRLIDVINGLRDIKTTVREIWLLLHLDAEPDGNFIIARVYLRDANLEKTNCQYKGNYIELAQIPQIEMIKPSKGLDRKVRFSNLGVARVPLPAKK